MLLALNIPKDGEAEDERARNAGGKNEEEEHGGGGKHGVRLARIVKELRRVEKNDAIRTT